jgi:hypothetical protein
MQERYTVIRQGQEVKRVSGVDHYKMQLDPREIIFFDELGHEIARMDAEIGDVVQPVVIGFYSPFPPIDQSEVKLEQLRRKYQEATGLTQRWTIKTQ